MDTAATNYKTLVRFDQINGYNPVSAITSYGSVLYGYANGGTYNYGVLFRLKKDGTEFQKIRDFTATNTGYFPHGAMTLSSSFSYGMTTNGGIYNKGVIYTISPSGSGYSVVHNFNGSDGAYPSGTLSLSGGVLYGMTSMGGTNGEGVVFKFNTDGSGYHKLIDLSGITGSYPPGTVVVAGSELYGVTGSGGPDNLGVIFKMNTDGTDYKILFNFSGTNAGYPLGTIVKSGSMLYGMAMNRISGKNLLFSINTDGTGFKILIESDGINAGTYGQSLIIDEPYLFCVTKQGGTNGVGTLFKIKTDGSDFLKLMDFSYSTGAFPQDPIIISDSKIYGTTNVGGPSEWGSVYAIRTDGTDFQNILDFSSMFKITPKKLNISKSYSQLSFKSQEEASTSGPTESSLSILDDALYIVASQETSDFKDSRIFKYQLLTTPVNDVKIVQDIKIYPNPASDFVVLEFKGASFAQAVVLNSAGIKVIDHLVSSGQQMDISGLQSGIYTVCIKNRYLKFIKL
jgi:uncharacterized repeat protein (TIGR03803 family)